MDNAREVSVSELRLKLGDVLDRAADGERFIVTRAGEPLAALVSPDEAAWCAALADRFRNRRPPFTQEALDHWLSEVLTPGQLSELLAH